MKRFIYLALALAILGGCQKTEAPAPAVPSIPSGPIQGQDETKLLQEILQKEPGNINAWIKLGNIYMDSKRFQEAIDAYGKALELDPNNVDVRVDLGTCYRNIGRSDRAVEEYRKGLEVDPNHLYGHMNLGVVLAFDFNDRANAIKEFEKFLELAPNAPNAPQIRQEIERLRSAK